MNMKPREIYVDINKKILRVSDTGTNHEEIIGPYLAMYYYKYMGFKWVCWNYEEEPCLYILQKETKDRDWEEYIYSVIVKQGTTFKEMEDIVNIIGYVPDYFLERNLGQVNLLHQTNYIEELSEFGYTLTDFKDGPGNYSFGRGVYCLDRDLFNKHGISGEWINSYNVYKGSYYGEYLRCIDDTYNNEKCGGKEGFQQEIIIPFNETEIKWEV